MNNNEIAINQLEKQSISFQCNQPKSYEECQDHRASLCAAILKTIIGKNLHIIDAGCGIKRLEKHFEQYEGLDLIQGDDIEEYIPIGDVIVFMNVLEHVTDLQKVLDNVEAEYVYISVPQENGRIPSKDHVRHLTLFDIKEMMPEWTLIGKWFWILRPRFWRLRYLLPIFSVYAEDEISLWRVK